MDSEYVSPWMAGHPAALDIQRQNRSWNSPEPGQPGLVYAQPRHF